MAISSESSSPPSSKLLADALALNLKKERDASKKRDEIFTPEELVPQSTKSFHLKDEGLRRRWARHRMEDGYGIITNIRGDSQLAFFGVFDGHGGKKAMENILSAMERVKRENEEVKFESAIRLVYLNTDQEFLNKCLSSGTCAATVVLRFGELHASNVGDCIVVMSRKGVAHVLTTDHHPGREDVKIRIENSGGCLSYHNGVWRVHGSLVISRALIGQKEGANSYLSPPSQFSAAVASDSSVSLHRELIPSTRISKISTAILSPPSKGENCSSSSSSKDHRSICIYDFPPEILDNILLLMDPNTFCRLRCTSRWCNDRFSNPAFCLSHYRRQLHRGLPLHQINWMEDGLNIYKNVFSIDFTHPPPHHYNIWPFAHPKKNVMVTASKSSCLGLLCLYGPECVCIYNPTSRSVVVDLPPFKYSHRFTTLAFGLMSSSNQLKVVNLTYCPRSSCRSRCKVLTIPSDLDNGWREAPAPPLYTTQRPLTASVEGSLYFLISCRLFRFDLETEQWSEVKLPLPIKYCSMISEFKGNLYLVTKANILYEVWLLREQDVWVKMWALTHCSGMLMHPVCHDEELESSLIVDRHDQLRWYKIDDGTHKECDESRHFNIPYVKTWASLKTLRDIDVTDYY